MENVILLGIKHCGKSTQGRLLAEKFGSFFFDTDDILTQMTGKTPRELYTEQGREAFLDAEAQACRVLASKSETFVAATGGGFCTNSRAVDFLRGVGKFIFLNVDEKIACDRIIKEVEISSEGTLKNLPSYIARENPATFDDVRRSFHKFFEERTKIYRELCNLEVKMLPVSKGENLKRILTALKSA